MLDFRITVQISNATEIEWGLKQISRICLNQMQAAFWWLEPYFLTLFKSFEDYVGYKMENMYRMQGFGGWMEDIIILIPMKYITLLFFNLKHQEIVLCFQQSCLEGYKPPPIHSLIYMIPESYIIYSYAVY